MGCSITGGVPDQPHFSCNRLGIYVVSECGRVGKLLPFVLFQGRQLLFIMRT